MYSISFILFQNIHGQFLLLKFTLPQPSFQETVASADCLLFIDNFFTHHYVNY